jgi:uncharacterized protein
MSMFGAIPTSVLPLPTTAFGCVGSTIRLSSGRYLDLLDPQPEAFTFHDVASALAKICRFGGQIDHFYSVAEHAFHCYGVAELDRLPKQTQWDVLMHDAAEAFLGDMVKPLKMILPAYCEIEKRMEAALSVKFGVNFDNPAIKPIDHALLIAERNQLFSGPDAQRWAGEEQVRRVDVIFRAWTWKEAYYAFTQTAKHLKPGVLES